MEAADRRLGEIRVRAWQAAYLGVMPLPYFDGLRAEDRTQMWRHHLADPLPRRHLVVIGDMRYTIHLASETQGAGGQA